MELLNTLISRHSVRTYNGEPLLSSDLEKLLKAAKAAPVGLGLYDQMHLTVVNNQDFIANANTATAAIMHREGNTPTYNVPTLIFVSAKKQNPMFTGMMISSAAMIAHNMVLEATDLGACYLWGVFTAVSNTPDLLSKQNLPDDYELLAAIGVGPTSETYEAREIPKDRISVNVVD
jgi:nitroreductase